MHIRFITQILRFQTTLNGPYQFLPHDEHYTAVRRNGAIKLRREEHGLASEEPVSVPTLLEETTKVHGEVSPLIIIIFQA